jgi:hypothetical protein
MESLRGEAWGAAATAPARGIAKSVDERHVPAGQVQVRAATRGVEATLVTGDLARFGFAGTGHAIV